MKSPIEAYTPGGSLDATRSLLIGMKEKGTLQSYVAQHRNSPEYPYLLALASSIDQISNATKAAQYQPAPQTVADQKLSALAPAPAPQPMMQLPEDSGIAQLPAKNIEGMAGGGIVAFEEGGEVPRFQDRGVVEDANLPEWVRRLPPDAWARTLYQAAMNKKPGVGLLQPQPQAYPQSLAPTIPANAPAPQSLSEGAVESMTAKPTSAPTTGLDKGTTSAPRADKTGISALTKPSTPAPASSKSAFKELEEAVYKNAPDKEAMLKEFEAIDKPFLEKAKASIDKERSRLEEGKEQDFYMALIEGGLAAAGGSSQYGLQNLAQGFGKGASSFNSAMKDFRKAAQENSKMEMELARYEATGKKDALKSYNDAQAKRDDRYAAAVTTLRAQEMQTQGAITVAGINAATTRDYLGSLRGSQLLETTRSHIASEVQKAADDARKAYKPMTPEQQQALFDQKFRAAIQANPSLAQLVGPITGGGGGGASLKYNPQTGKIE